MACLFQFHSASTKFGQLKRAACVVKVHLKRHKNIAYLSDSDDTDDAAGPIFARGRVQQNLESPTILRQQM